MCSETKNKIVAAMRELMQERSIRKITVQDLMTRTNMKRQSFYYHFQDIYDVLSFAVDRQFFAPLAFDPSQSSEEWSNLCLRLLDSDRSFYRKVINAIGRSRTIEKCTPIFRPQMLRLMFPDSRTYEQLCDDERFAVDFLTYALISYLIDDVLGHEPLDTEYGRRRMMASCRAATRLSQQDILNASVPAQKLA